MIFAKQTMLGDGWAQNVRLTVASGAISGIETNQTPQPGDGVVDILLPALANLHSPSFQRAMVGMTEYRRAGKGSFRTWRDLMSVSRRIRRPGISRPLPPSFC
jgi:formimidoylglutamate deiminase